MTGSALDLALKLVVRHDKLENVKHGVLHDPHCRGLRNSNPFPFDRAQKDGLSTCELQSCLCIIP